MSTFKKHHWFLVIYAIYLILAAYILLTMSKTDSHLLLTNWHNSFGDIVFKYSTHLGDGLAIVIYALIALYFGKKYFLQIAISGFISGLIAQLLKKVVYGPTPRPIKFFAETDISIYQVPGVSMNEVFSYPSGHATSAFCMAASFALLANKKRYDIIFGILGTLIAYSRIYLSQHFLEDIVYGSIIGVTTAFMVNWLLSRRESKNTSQY